MELWNLQGLQEGVGFTLGANGGGGTVAGQNFGFIGEGQQARLDGVDDLAKVAAGQVGAADAAGKQRVPRDEQFERDKVQTN